jgi:group I intron endonuclease
MLVGRAINKHGVDAFEVTVLQECADPDALNAAERDWIRELRTFKPEGYNMTLGGEGILGLKHTDETKAKMSRTRTGVKLGPMSPSHKAAYLARKVKTGKGPRPNARGWHHSEEAKAKIASNNRHLRRAKVVHLDMEGNVLGVYDTMKAAEAATGIDRRYISACCRFKRSVAGSRFEIRPADR